MPRRKNSQITETTAVNEEVKIPESNEDFYDPQFEFLIESLNKVSKQEAVKILQHLLRIHKTGVLDDTTTFAFDQQVNKSNLVQDYKNFVDSI